MTAGAPPHSPDNPPGSGQAGSQGAPQSGGPIRLVLFDMDDVLYAYNLPVRLAAMGAATGLAPREVFDALWGSGFEPGSDAGSHPDPDDYLAGVCAQLGRPLSRADWIAARRDSMTPMVDSLAIAAEVAKSCRLAVLTNNGPLLAAAADEIAPEAKALAGDNFFASAQLGAKKPDPEAFRRCLERLGVAPNEAFFIDDKPRNIKGALAAGLAVHRFLNAPALRRALVEVGVLAR